MLFNLKRSNL